MIPVMSTGRILLSMGDYQRHIQSFLESLFNDHSPSNKSMDIVFLGYREMIIVMYVTHFSHITLMLYGLPNTNALMLGDQRHPQSAVK